MSEFINIWSKGEVVRYMELLLRSKKIRDCSKLRVVSGYLEAYYLQCLEEWASREKADNVPTDDTATSAPRSYWWPVCPADCPVYMKADNFPLSMTTKLSTVTPSYDHYIHSSRINDFRNLKQDSYDMSRLVRMCEELNVCYSNQAWLAAGMLVRALLDHVPPIFDKLSFAEVVDDHSAGKSFRERMQHLENNSRKVADSFLHTRIRRHESLPTQKQVDFKNDLDALLREVVRILKSREKRLKT
jgi:hypothetical protein